MKYCKIHFGRENLNKEKYMFDEIKRSENKILLLVPDQFTLQAEKEAFFYLEARGLMDLEVLSFSRLGARVIAETGGGGKARIDECGRYMLITKLTAENRASLTLFKNSSKLASFSQMAGDLIYEMKQYNTTPADLVSLAGSIDGDALLKQKLKDISLIYSEYEKYTKTKYLDGEDYIELFTSKISDSGLVADSVIWIYGFDYFTPKNLELIKALMKHARETNVLMTCESATARSRDEEIFELTVGVIKKLKNLAAESGVEVIDLPVPRQYAKGKEEKREAIAAIERELFSIPARTCASAEGITLVKAANIHSEIESAAAYVLELVRDHGLKYKDIAIICNDTDERAWAAKRVFSEYGVSLFLDQKRSFTHNVAVRFIVALIDAVIYKYRSPDIFSMLKTGMTDIPAYNYEELENYSIKYKIRGNKWKKEFSKGAEEYGEVLPVIEESRKEVMSLIEKFEEPFIKAETVRRRTEALYVFLSEMVKMPEKLDAIAAGESERGLREFAEETTQAWKCIVNTFDQFVEIMGDEKISESDFANVLKVGFESVEVGLLPPAADGLAFGTMQRMRLGRVKALLVIGANEGILPAAMAREGILNDDEKNWLFGQNIEICRREELRLSEERIAIYKNMSRPGKYLWVSYSISDNDGGKLIPSQIFEKLKEIFPTLEIQKDIVSGNNLLNLIQSRKSTLRHMANSLRESMAYERTPAWEWMRTADWYKENEKYNFDIVADGLFFRNNAGKLNGSLADALYSKDREDMTLSPSRLERYGRCPFAFFMNYGLRPEELRVFEIAGREIGDIYHNCIMRFSRELTGSGISVTDPDSRWMKITKEDCDEIIERLIDEEAGIYREGVFSQGSEEIYRTGRIKTVCAENAWILVRHVRAGNILSMGFEEKFGRATGRIPPIEVETASGKRVLIEGKIDRVDILADGSVKIVDYKSGMERFNIAEAKAGFRLQLMLYLKAAQGQKAAPAGVFYYIIDEKVETGRMSGVVVNKSSIIDNIAGDFRDFSDIIPVRKLKDGRLVGNSADNLLDETEFSELQASVDKKVKELCGELISGRIDVKPKKSGDISACTYCGYNGVCSFDLNFDGFKYENI